ncbi:MAG: hypothetical protein AAF999_11420 [Pseudomonadota bacterium]
MRLPLALIFLLGSACAATAQGRSEVHMFKYGGLGPQVPAVLDEFRYIMGEKMLLLSTEVLGGEEDPGLSAISNLKLKPVMKNEELEDPNLRVGSLTERAKYWRDTGALAVLTGRVRATDPTALSIRSTFFLGDLGRKLGGQSVSVELPVDAAAYESTKDSHSVTILASLAVNLIYPNFPSGTADCAKTAAAFALLNQAQQRAGAVMEDDQVTGATLKKIVDAATGSVEGACPVGG